MWFLPSRRVAALALVALLASVVLGSSSRQATPSLPPSAERAYRALTTRVERAAALDVTAAMDGTWRLAGNPSYNAAIDQIRQRLLAAGFSAARDATAAVRVEEYPAERPGWDYRVGTVTFDGETEPALLSREQDQVSLAVNSFSTVPAGLVAPLVDVGAASAADYAGKTIGGAVVLTDAPLGRVWREAVLKRGAAGVISTGIAAYVRPSGRALSEEEQNVLQWDTIPYDAAARSFGFKASWRSSQRMRQRLGRGPVSVRVQIASTFYEGPHRTLIAELRGRSRPSEHIVLAAHLQEPGTNDNASGCGTLYAMARALSEAIRSGALPPPERTMTFLWVDEIRGSREWLRAHSADGRGVQYMFALDMTGEDTTKTGGSFLVEKQADPSAVWARPSDPPSEWASGPSGQTPQALRGTLLNDLYLAVCRRRARDAGWTVRTNPYEGGSDHEVFAAAGIPSLLGWHFTDRYYHTNQDRLDKTSATEMQHVGIATGTTAWMLASATSRDAETVVDLLASAAAARLALERSQGEALVANAGDREAAAETERQVVAAWIKWYSEAFDSALRLPAEGPDAALRARVAAAVSRLR